MGVHNEKRQCESLLAVKTFVRVFDAAAWLVASRGIGVGSSVANARKRSGQS